tara:strand:+ start:443 stop:844 length:402 start_codon:yes stop_codon:yes gene_type:complete
MIISIIVSDTTVVIDGVGYSDMDVSSLAANIHAIQFNTTTSKGHIEYNDGTVNEDITSIAPYQSIVDVHIAKKANEDSAAATGALEQTALEATYGWKREKEYPSIADQLDDIYHNGIDAWKATIKTTKDKYPK